MIEKLFKLEIILVTLIFSFICLSCGSDDDKELLEGIVNFDGNYTTQANEETTTFLFSKGNKFTLTNSDSEAIVVGIYKVSEISAKTEAGEYIVSLNLISYKNTLLTQEAVNEANLESKDLKYPSQIKDWELNVEKDLTQVVSDDIKKLTLVIKVSEDKNTLISRISDKLDSAMTFTYKP